MLDSGCGLKTELVRKLLLEAKIGLGSKIDKFAWLKDRLLDNNACYVSSLVF